MEPRLAVTAADQRRRFELIIRSDPGLMRLLTILRELALLQWRLVAGCLYQTVWNILTARPRGTGISDYDVIYFDDSDLSWDAEDAVIRRVAGRDRDRGRCRAGRIAQPGPGASVVRGALRHAVSATRRRR
jgi:hypothetical protein